MLRIRDIGDGVPGRAMEQGRAEPGPSIRASGPEGKGVELNGPPR